MKSTKESTAYVESELLDQNRNRVPFVAEGIGTRIGMVADLLGARRNAYELAGVSSATLQRYLAEETAPTFDAMARLCLAAGVRMEWLATGDAPMLIAGEESEAGRGSQTASPNLDTLRDALVLIDQALALTRRTASVEARAHLVAKAYDVLLEEGSVAAALRRIMTAVVSETGE